MLIFGFVPDIDPHHPRDVTEPVFHPLEYFSTEIIVLHKSYNPFSGVERLYVVGIDPPLLPNCRVPAHCPREQRWIAQIIVSGGDKQLRNLLFIQVFANGKVPWSSERTEHQEDVVLLDKTARKVKGGRGIRFVII